MFFHRKTTGTPELKHALQLARILKGVRFKQKAMRKPVKPKTCKAPSANGRGTCGNKFMPRSSTQSVCSPLCAARKVAADNEKKARIAEKRAKQEMREKRESLMTVSDWIKKVHSKYNPYIRARDADMPCISCGRGGDIEWTSGGVWDCGHYLSVGSHPELRFEPLNAAKQCKSCNGGSGNYAKKNYDVAASYRVNLIARIGLERVEWLEGNHDPKKYTIPELKLLPEHFAKLIKEETAKNSHNNS